MAGRRNLTAQKTALPFGRHTRVPACAEEIRRECTLAPPGEYDKMICAAAMRVVATFTVETRPRSVIAAELLSDYGGTAAAVKRHEHRSSVICQRSGHTGRSPPPAVTSLMTSPSRRREDDFDDVTRRHMTSRLAQPPQPQPQLHTGRARD